jgi:hypothetical protein
VCAGTPLAPTPSEADDFGPADKAATLKTDTVLPGWGYGGGRLRRVLLGRQYRELWRTPIEVPLLDLDRYAGGLTPTKKTGSRQTIGLRFENPDGIEYNFRSVDKEPANALPPALQKSPIEKLFQDQMSAQYPAAAIIAAGLLETAGVLHPKPRLFVLPDDPRLGKFREEYAGLLGMIEEHRPRFPGARGVVETPELFDSLQHDPAQQVDSREFLKARLMDILMGDWDRHADQWQWSAFARNGGIVWRPVPEDRDWAFARMDGPIATIVRQYFPQTIGFGRDYPPMHDLTWTAKDLDRRLLAGLERSAWDSVVRFLQKRLTDSAIARAIRRQPAPFVAIEGEWLADALRNRRDHLPEAAAEFYDLLARVVDVHGVAVPEVAEVEHEPSGSVLVTLRPRAKRATPTFRRRFVPEETDEIRIYLHGGQDIATVRGERTGIKVRVIGGEIDQLVDSSSGGAHFYPDRLEERLEQDAPSDDSARTASEKGGDEKSGEKDSVKGEESDRKNKDAGKQSDDAGKKDGDAGRKNEDPDEDEEAAKLSAPELMSSETFGPPPRPDDFLKTHPIDWGHRWVNLPWASFHAGQGVLLGVAFNRYGYAFRAHPYRTRVSFKAGWAFGGMGPRIEAFAEDHQLFHLRTLELGGRLEFKASKVEPVRFFGYGNETTRTSPGSAGRFLQDKVRIGGALLYESGPLRISAGPNLQWTDPHRIPGSRLDLVAPLGAEPMTLAGVDVSAGLEVGAVAGRGTGGNVRVGTRVARSLGDTDARFARSEAVVVAYSALPGMPRPTTLLVRAGVQRVWGTYPFQEAAQLGGHRTLRGHDKQRFAGDAATHFGSELRFAVIDTKGAQAGVLGLADVGRVYLDGESSSRWHSGVGGGLWGGMPGLLIVNLIVAHSERYSVSVYTGFGF